MPCDSGHCTIFHSQANIILFLRVAGSHRCHSATLPAGGSARWSRAPCLQQSGAVLIPTAHVPATALPASWAENLRAISGPSMVDLAWENLRSRLLDTTTFLRREGHSLGLAPSVWRPNPSSLVPTGPRQSPPAACVRQHELHPWAGLPVDKCWLVALGVVVAQRSPI